MAYTITLSDGTVLTTVANNTVDTTTTSLALIGRNFAGYGGYIAEDFIHLLENFANTTAPSAPLVGQLFYNKTSSALQVWTGTQWVSAGFPADGVLKDTDVTVQNGDVTVTNPSAMIDTAGSVYISNTAIPSDWRITIGTTSPYVGMLVFQMKRDNNWVTIMALDGVNNKLLGPASAAYYS